MESLRFASSPWGFRFTPIEVHCQWLRDHGMRYICGQFFQESFKDASGLFPPDITQPQIDQALALVGRYGLKYATFNVTGDFMVRQGLDAEIALCCHQIDLAAKFKPEFIVVFAGWVDRNDAPVYTQVAQALKTVSRHARQYGIKIALENHGGLTTTAAQIDRILGAVDEPNLGVNYDPANFEMYGVDPLQALQQLHSKVVFTHFKSVKRRADGKKVYCRLREGYIDYRPIIAELRKRGYESFWTIEYEEPKDVFEGSADDLKDLRDLLK